MALISFTVIAMLHNITIYMYMGAALECTYVALIPCLLYQSHQMFIHHSINQFQLLIIEKRQTAKLNLVYN